MAADESYCLIDSLKNAYIIDLQDTIFVRKQPMVTDQTHKLFPMNAVRLYCTIKSRLIKLQTQMVLRIKRMLN